MARYAPPFTIGADPQFGMYLVFWDNLTADDVTHEQIIVHSLGNNLSHG